MWVVSPQGEALSVEPTVGHLVLSNGTRVQVKRAWGNLTKNGTREMIPAVPDRTIRLLSLFLSNGVGAATTVTLKSDTTEIGPLISLPDGAFKESQFCIYGHAQGLLMADPINATVSNGSDVGFVAHYIELTDDLFDLL